MLTDAEIEVLDEAELTDEEHMLDQSVDYLSACVARMIAPRRVIAEALLLTAEWYAPTGEPPLFPIQPLDPPEPILREMVEDWATP